MQSLHLVFRLGTRGFHHLAAFIFQAFQALGELFAQRLDFLASSIRGRARLASQVTLLVDFI
jgi:hypothetical protein